jgi:hypothetical protein
MESSTLFQLNGIVTMTRHVVPIPTTTSVNRTGGIPIDRLRKAGQGLRSFQEFVLKRQEDISQLGSGVQIYSKAGVLLSILRSAHAARPPQALEQTWFQP